jgi:hypothetical protein
MSRHDDIDNQMRDAFAAARTATPTQREISTVMRRLDKKPVFRFPKLRIAIAAPIAAAALLAGVVAVDSLRGDNDGGPTLVDRAIAASTPRANSIRAMDVGLTMKFEGGNASSAGDAREIKMLRIEGWQLGSTKTGIGRAVIFTNNKKPLVEIYHKDGHSTMYAKKGNVFTSFKGTKLPSEAKDKDAGSLKFDEIEEEMMSDPQAFYVKSLKGNDGVKVLGDTTVRGKKAHQLSMNAPMDLKEDGMTAKVRIFVAQKTFKPLEMRLVMSEPKSKVKITVSLLFNRYESIPNTPKAVTDHLNLNVPKSAKQVSPIAFEAKMNASLAEAMLGEMMPEINKEINKAKPGSAAA